eukprot:9471184-Pyramimonas_sp.AAC.1
MDPACLTVRALPSSRQWHVPLWQALTIVTECGIRSELRFEEKEEVERRQGEERKDEEEGEGRQ